MKLILASNSPRRRELIQKLGVQVLTESPQVDETVPAEVPAENAAEMIAVRKAAAIAKKYPDAVVIAADTTVILDGEILGKPKDHADCVRMLHALSGRMHKVITGVAIFWGGHSASFSDETEVQFYPLTDAEIAAYADSDEPYDKAGAYGIQGQGGLLVAGIHGDYYNVVGLPIARLARQLRDFGLL